MTSEELTYDDDCDVIVEKLRDELDELKLLIKEFSLEEFPKVRRFGLPIFSKEHLI